MTTTSISEAAPAEQPVRRSRINLRRQLTGFAYTIPTLVFIVVFFLTPLVLVAKMSLSKYGLLTGDEGLNFPKNYVSIWRNPLFWPSVWFTVQYTVLVTVMLLGLGLGLALLVQTVTRWSALLSTTFLVVWKFAGFYMLVLTVGLQGISEAIKRAAALRGDARYVTRYERPLQ